MKHKEITIFESLDSTNNYAMRQVHAGMAAHGDAIMALQQSEGKGQHGKIWLAVKGESILMSMIFNLNVPESAIFPIALTQQFELSAMIAVATREWFATYAGDNVFIKWPNDIYHNDRKAGGILIENVIGKQMSANETEASSVWKWAVAGLGININQQNFPYFLLNPISLRLITGKDYDIMELANSLKDNIEKYWQKWLDGEWPAIFKAFNQYLYKRGEKVRLRKANVIMPCTIKSVSEKGKLLIEEDDQVEFSVGEVSWEMALNV